MGVEPGDATFGGSSHDGVGGQVAARVSAAERHGSENRKREPVTWSVGGEAPAFREWA